MLAALAAASACGVDDPGQEHRAKVARTQPDNQLLPMAAEVSNDLGFTLLRALSDRDPGNLVISPYALSSSLGMLDAGAADETRNQLDALLHAGNGGDVHQAFNAADLTIEQRSGDRRNRLRKGRVDVYIARSLWAQRGTAFKDPYLELLATDYGSGVRLVDFRSDPEAAREAMNRWGKDATGGAISDVTPRGSATEFSRLIEATAFYLKAPWEIQFRVDQTRPMPFALLDGGTSQPQTMTMVAPEGLLAGQGDGYQVVEIPYLGQELSMVLMIPDRGKYASFIEKLDGAAFSNIVESLRPGAVELHVPRFQFTSQLTLDEKLRSLGIPDAFDEQRAELSGMTNDEALYVNTVLHQAFLSIDEEGTQARAATVQSSVPATTPAPIKVIADRPFVAAVRDRSSGVVLALSTVVNPKS